MVQDIANVICLHCKYRLPTKSQYLDYSSVANVKLLARTL